MLIRKHNILAQRATTFASLAAVLLLVAGCGGTSQSDLKRLGIRRIKDVDAPPPATKPAAPPTNTAAQPPAEPSVAASKQAPPRRPAAVPPKLAANPPAAKGIPSSSKSDEPPADSASSASTKQASDTQAPPNEPLSPDARLRRTVENLTRIGQAWHAYVEDKKVHPTRAILDRNNKPLLSWRVELLPYLGYKELYEKFHREEPWGSRHNRPLLDQIPAVYQSPERFDEYSNYLVPVSANTIFGLPRPAMNSDIEDGPGNTVVVVEADDSLAVPWTEPRDYELNIMQPKTGLGGLRSGSFYVVWGDGEVGRVLTSAPLGSLRAMFTYDAGEGFISGNIDQPLLPSQVLGRAGLSDGSTPPADSESAGKAGSGRSSRQATSSTDLALSALAATDLENSEIERATGGERAAAEWFYASALASPVGGSWVDQYQWYPALRRPAPPIRFGVGLVYTGPRASEVANATASQGNGAGKPAAWSLVTAKTGDEFVKVLSEHAQPSDDAATGKSPAPRPMPRRNSALNASPGAPLAPGVYYLATAREGVLREAAEREMVDVLVLVTWREVGKNYSIEVQLVDVVRKQTILELPRIDSGQIEKSKVDPLANNPLPAALHKLADFLDEQLTPQPLPQQIEPRHVVGRFTTLASSKDDNPLRALAEMRFYRERNLATDTQLLLGYQTLVGQQLGSDLFLGDAAVRTRVLKAWLPRPPERNTAQRTLPTSSNDD